MITIAAQGRLRNAWNGVLTSCVLALAGCEAEPPAAASPAGTAGAPAGTAGTAGSPPIAVPLDCSQPNAPPAPLRRLTRFELNNTLRDLLGITTRPADALPGEELGNGFGNDADALGVSRLLIDGYRSVARDVALELTGDPSKLATLVGCDLVADEAGCSASFVATLGTKAFRRPLEAGESAALLAMFAQGKQLAGTVRGGVQALLELVLQSPQLLYRVEQGVAVDPVRKLARPTSYEMATRLSYFLWGSAPDVALLDAAARDELVTPAQVLAQAERLLADARAHDVVRYFHNQWLGTGGLDGLVRSADFYPTFKPGLGALYRRETEQLIDHVLWQDQGTLGALFTAPYTFVNEQLASVYGLSGIVGEGFQKVALDPTRRAGLLTQPSILAITTPGSRTDPVVRGKWVYTKFLCGRIADPPANVPQLPEPDPGLSVRDRLAQHRAADACKGCHQLMDPIGFGFEHYDGMGQWRDTDNALPIDANGEIIGSDVAGPFTGAVELGQKLAQSQDVQRCFVGNWLTYAYGRAESDRDLCTRSALESAFATSGGRVRDLLLALTQTDAFLYRPMP